VSDVRAFHFDQPVHTVLAVDTLSMLSNIEVEKFLLKVRHTSPWLLVVDLVTTSYCDIDDFPPDHTALTDNGAKLIRSRQSYSALFTKYGFKQGAYCLKRDLNQPEHLGLVHRAHWFLESSHYQDN
jgi:hypothetical protein